MKRTFRISEEDAQQLDALLHQFGFIYEQTETRTRYDLGRFISSLAHGKFSLTPDQKHVRVEFRIHPSDVDE